MVFGRSQWTPASLLGVSEDQRFSKSDEEQLEHLGRALGYYHTRLASKMGLSSSEELCWIVCNENVAARVQSGPTCGLVAIRMAAEHFSAGLQSTGHESTESEQRSGKEEGAGDEVSHGRALLQHAVSLGVTRVGEMFSALDLATVANSWYGQEGKGHCLGNTTVPVNAVGITFPETARDVVAHLFENTEAEDGRSAHPGGRTGKRLMAVPYDSAPNHEPYLGGGSHAHWGLLKGIAVPVLAEELEREQWKEWLGDDCLARARVCSDVRLIVIDSDTAEKALTGDIWSDDRVGGPNESCVGDAEESTSLKIGWMSFRQEEGINAAAETLAKGKCCKQSLFVIIQQSKSKNQLVCPFGMLHASNNNLLALDEERARQFYMPKGMAELQHHAVLLSAASS